MEYHSSSIHFLIKRRDVVIDYKRDCFISDFRHFRFVVCLNEETHQLRFYRKLWYILEEGKNHEMSVAIFL